MAIEKITNSRTSSVPGLDNRQVNATTPDEENERAFREQAQRLVQKYPNRIDQSPAARKLRTSIAKRLRDLDSGLKYLKDRLDMLSIGLSKSTLINLQQRMEDIEGMTEMLNYYEYEIGDIKKLLKGNNVDVDYVCMLRGLKITKDDRSKEMDRLKGEIGQRYIQLSKLRDLEDRLFIIESTAFAGGPAEADRELQMIFVELNALAGDTFFYDDQRRALLRSAYKIRSAIPCSFL